MSSYLLIICTALSFCSMTYEYLLTKLITDLSDNFVLWESLTIGIYLLGIGLGVALYNRFHKRDDTSFLIQTEWFLIALALLMFPLLWGGHLYYRSLVADYQHTNSGGLRSLTLMLLCYQTLPLAIGLLSGLELTALLRLAAQCSPPISFSRLWFCYYLGALVACLAFSGIFAGMLSLLAILLLATSINFVVAFSLRWKQSSWWPALVLLNGWVLLPLIFPYLQQLHLKNIYFNHLQLTYQDGGFVPRNFWTSLASYPDITRIQSPYQTIDLVPNLAPEPGVRLYLDQHLQFDSNDEAAYHEVLAHVPTMLKDTIPKRVAVLGGGDGLLVRELLKYGNEIAHITLVELDPTLIDLANKPPLVQLNQRALTHPKVEVIVADALHWLRHCEQIFDAIYLDFPYPYDLNGLRLYSQEFFAMAYGALEPARGFIAMDLPLHLNTEDFSRSNELMLATISNAGFHSILGFAFEGESFLLASNKETIYSMDYRSLPFEVQVITEEYFNRYLAFYQVDSWREKREGNSLLKTRALPFADLRF